MLTISGTLEELMRHLPAIVGAGVEVRVEVTDRNPGRWPADEGPQWYFEEDFRGDEPTKVPPKVWERMWDKQSWGPSVDCLIYDTEAEARQALSDGILAWAWAARKKDQ